MKTEANIYRCSADCSSTFKHTSNEDDCESIQGQCEHLVKAGWRLVWVRIMKETERTPRLASSFRPRTRRLLLARGGWLCPGCVERYGYEAAK
jgi:hypothetical protein